MSEVIVYGAPQSTYVRSARMTCAEKGVAHVNAPIAFGSPEHAALHPFRRIPVFRHGDFTLYETVAIQRYVDRVFDGPALQPADPVVCARMDQWLSIVNDYVYSRVNQVLLYERLIKRFRGQQADEGRIAEAMPRIEEVFGVIEARLSENAFLAGEALTLADLLLIPIVAYCAALPEAERLIAPRPGIVRWHGALSARPSFAATAPPPAGAAAG